MLNAAAGRTVGDQVNPPILPWVTDFTSRIEFDDDSTMVEETELESPWRDLTKVSKSICLPLMTGSLTAYSLS
jgi:hypothetical protein